MRDIKMIDLNYEYKDDIGNISVWNLDDFEDLVRHYFSVKITEKQLLELVNRNCVFFYKQYGDDEKHYNVFSAKFNITLIDKELKIKNNQSEITINLSGR